MTFYLNMNAFHWGTPLDIFDASGHRRYTLTGDAYAPGRRLHVADLAGREAIYIHQRLPSLFPRFEIEVYGRPVCELVKNLTFSHPRYTPEMLDWEISGTSGAGGYEITRQDTVFASSRPSQTPSGPMLELIIPDQSAGLTALAVLLTIHCIFAPQELKHYEA